MLWPDGGPCPSHGRGRRRRGHDRLLLGLCPRTATPLSRLTANIRCRAVAASALRTCQPSTLEDGSRSPDWLLGCAQNVAMLTSTALQTEHCTNSKDAVPADLWPDLNVVFRSAPSAQPCLCPKTANPSVAS